MRWNYLIPLLTHSNICIHVYRFCSIMIIFFSTQKRRLESNKLSLFQFSSVTCIFLSLSSSTQRFVSVLYDDAVRRKKIYENYDQHFLHNYFSASFLASSFQIVSFFVLVHMIVYEPIL